MKVHYIKEWTQRFLAIDFNSRQFAVRKDDLGIEEGDCLVVVEINGDGQTGRFGFHGVEATNSSVVGVEAGYIAMVLDPLNEHWLRKVLAEVVSDLLFDRSKLFEISELINSDKTGLLPGYDLSDICDLIEATKPEVTE
jgi:hypothetical protein